jgi:hypothetical protein
LFILHDDFAAGFPNELNLALDEQKKMGVTMQ